MKPRSETVSPRRSSSGSPRLTVAALAVFVSVFCLYPLLALVAKSLASASGGGVDASAYLRVLGGRRFWGALATSTYSAALTTALALSLGAGLAWVAARTDFRARRAVSILAYAGFAMPSYMIGLSWLQLFGRNGYVNRVAGALGLGARLASPYSVEAAAVVMALHLYPLVFLSLRAAFGRGDPALERAARLAGAGPVRAAFDVVVPLAIPTIVSMGLLTFSRALANFDVPALLALPIRKEFLTTLVYAAMSDLDIGTASAVSVALVALSAVPFVAGAALSRKRSFSEREARDGLDRRIALGVPGRLVAYLLLAVQVVVSLAPFCALAASSFLKRWGLPFRAEYLTLGNYYELFFHNEQAARALANSLFYGIAGASIAVLVAVAILFVSRFGRMRAATWLEALASWPLAAPHIVVAMAAVLAWNSGPLRLYGTRWGIVAAYAAIFIPLALRNVRGAVDAHDADIVDAARLSGASFWRASRDIAVPAVAPSIKAAWLLCFMIALREIPVSLLLYASGQESLGVLLFGMQSQSYGMEMTSALSMSVVALLLAGSVVVRRLGKGGRGDGPAY